MRWEPNPSVSVRFPEFDLWTLPGTGSQEGAKMTLCGPTLPCPLALSERFYKHSFISMVLLLCLRIVTILVVNT